MEEAFTRWTHFAAFIILGSSSSLLSVILVFHTLNLVSVLSSSWFLPSSFPSPYFLPFSQIIQLFLCCASDLSSVPFPPVHRPALWSSGKPLPLSSAVIAQQPFITALFSSAVCFSQCTSQSHMRSAFTHTSTQPCLCWAPGSLPSCVQLFLLPRPSSPSLTHSPTTSPSSWTIAAAHTAVPLQAGSRSLVNWENFLANQDQTPHPHQNKQICTVDMKAPPPWKKKAVNHALCEHMWSISPVSHTGNTRSRWRKDSYRSLSICKKDVCVLNSSPAWIMQNAHQKNNIHVVIFCKALKVTRDHCSKEKTSA